MIVHCENISRSIAGQSVFKNFTHRFLDGKFYAVLGRNGAGKTTLLRCISRIDRPDDGVISYFDHLTANPIQGESFFQKLAWVPASSPRIFDFSVNEMILMGRYPHHRGFPNNLDRELCKSAIDELQLTLLANRSIRTLSTGEFHKALIGRALALHPEVLILDEPSAHLDWPSTCEFFALLKKLSRKGKTIIASMHDPLIAQKFSDELIGIHNSHISTSEAHSASGLREFLNEVFGSLPENPCA